MVVKASKAKKKTVTIDLYRPLQNYIVFNYSEREARNLEDDLQILKQLRSDLEREPRRQRDHDLTAVVLDQCGSALMLTMLIMALMSLMLMMELMLMMLIMALRLMMLIIALMLMMDRPSRNAST
ncbi:hypothetical protein CsSME_00003822 [Camellia sinensis var. sinensis]